MLCEFSHRELLTFVDALKRAARRQESEAQADPRNAGPHEQKASEMRRLALKIETQLAVAFEKATS